MVTNKFMWAGILAVVLSLAAAAAGQPSDSTDVTDRFVIPDDLQVTLWAESPQLYNPTNMAVDARGRIWVTEAVNYRSFNNAPDTRLNHPGGERIVILEDTDGDGVSDSSKTFVQDPDLRSPLGIAVMGNKVVVSASPSLIVYTDTDGDDHPEEKETLLTGFGGIDHDHGLHAVTAGPDGRWYFNTGNAGPHIVEDQSGWTLRSGSIYTGGTPYNKNNQPAMVSDDGRIYTGGLALRVEPDGTNLTVLGHNFRNAYELAVDSYGNLWTNDNDDQVQTCRTLWLMEGGNVGYFSADGTRTWQADRRPGQDMFTAHWHQEDPGVIPAGDQTGAGAPAGIVINESDALGEKYRGMLLSADAGRNLIFGYHPERTGAGYALDNFRFLSSVSRSTADYVWHEVEEDTRHWFRPSDVIIGTDGAIYVADWYDPIVGGHAMRDSVGYGRIYRISPKNERLNTPELNLSTTEGQINALLNPAVNVRSQGFRRLTAQGSAVIDRVISILDSDNPYHRARAVWLLAQLGPAGVDRAENLLADDDPAIRITAFRALRQATDRILPYARKLASDTSMAVRRAVAVALREIPLEMSRDVFVELARRYEGNDRWYVEALGTAVEGDESAAYELLRERFATSNPAAWSDAFARITWRLHPPEAVGALEQRAAADELSAERRLEAVTALAFIDDSRAAAAMQSLAVETGDPVASRASWWIDFRRTNTWRSYLTHENTPRAAADARDDLQLSRMEDQLLDDGAADPARLRAAESMASTAAGAMRLIALAANGELPPLAQHAIADTIFSNPDRTVRVLAKSYFDTPSTENTVTAAGVDSLEGIRDRGRMLFQSNCSSCHRVGDVGYRVGPDLTSVHEKLGRQALIESVTAPSRDIAFGYDPVVVSTTDGTVVAGFLLGRGATVVVRDSYGQRHTFDRDRVEAITPISGSLMPGPDELRLSAQDIADLVQFLEFVEAGASSD